MLLAEQVAYLMQLLTAIVRKRAWVSHCDNVQCTQCIFSKTSNALCRKKCSDQSNRRQSLISSACGTWVMQQCHWTRDKEHSTTAVLSQCDNGVAGRVKDGTRDGTGSHFVTQ